MEPERPSVDSDHRFKIWSPPDLGTTFTEAIISSTLMYGTKITWGDQRNMETSFQKSINRMARSALEVLPSTPVAFLQAEGGSAPAAARLERRRGGSLRH